MPSNVDDDELNKLRQLISEHDNNDDNTNTDNTNTDTTQQDTTSSQSLVSSEQTERDSRSIYISQVDYSTSEDELLDLFSNVGKIVKVTIGRNKFTGQALGYAYIEFENPDDVEYGM